MCVVFHFSISDAEFHTLSAYRRKTVESVFSLSSHVQYLHSIASPLVNSILQKQIFLIPSPRNLHTNSSNTAQHSYELTKTTFTNIIQSFLHLNNCPIGLHLHVLMLIMSPQRGLAQRSPVLQSHVRIHLETSLALQLAVNIVPL